MKNDTSILFWALIALMAFLTAISFSNRACPPAPTATPGIQDQIGRAHNAVRAPVPASRRRGGASSDSNGGAA